MRKFIFILFLFSALFCVSSAADSSLETQGKVVEKQRIFGTADVDNFTTAMLISYIPYFEFLKIKAHVPSGEFFVACQNVLLAPLPPEYVKTVNGPVNNICKSIVMLDTDQFAQIVNDVRLKNKEAYEEAYETYAEEIQKINKEFALTQVAVDKCLKEKEHIFLYGREKQEACFVDKKLEKTLAKYSALHKETKEKIRNVYYSMLLSFMGGDVVNSISKGSQYIVFYNYFIGELSGLFSPNNLV